MELNELIINRATIQKEKNSSKEYTYTLLQRMSKQNKLNKISKGKYTKSVDIIAIATNLFSPSYLSYWSASYFKGYTEQIINQIQIITTKRHKSINFMEHTIQFIPVQSKYFFGFEKIKYGNNFIFVVEDEKLLIDTLTKEKFVGNFDEIIKIFQKTKINKDTLIKYLKKINNLSLNKRIGYMLEKYKNIDLSKEITYKDKNYAKLSIFLDEKKINKKWMVKL